MATRDDVIEELVSLILMQYKEIRKLKRTIQRIEQYIEVYEDHIKGEKL